MEAKQKGGKRNGSGRKPSVDPKVPVTIYVPQSKIEINGGKPELVIRITEAVNNDFMVNPVLERIAENNTPAKKKAILEKRNTPHNLGVKHSSTQPLPASDFMEKNEDPNYPIKADKETAFEYRIRCAEYNESKQK